MMDFVMKPFCLVNQVVVVGVRVWFQVMKSIVRIPLDLSWTAAVWTIALITLPARIFTALQRDRMLEVNLYEMQIQLEDLAFETKELEEQLRRAIKERKVVETILEDIEDEHENALCKIDLLENELQELKEKNLRLNKVHGKAMLDYEAHDGRGGYVHEGIPLAANYGIPSWGSDYKRSGVTIEDNIPINQEPWGKEEKGSSYPEGLRNLIMGEVLESRRNVALARSLFSAMLSLLVGMIIWEAEDPCMPLVAALSSVVGMSLASVLQFFSTIKNKPASDAVALLCLNWFILGMLTSPSLPSITRVLAPRAFIVIDWVVNLLGLSV